MTSVDVDLSALGRRNNMADQVFRAVKVHLQTISGATNLWKEIGTKKYILSKLFGPKCPLIEGYILVVEYVDANFESIEQQVQTTTICTSLVYNLS